MFEGHCFGMMSQHIGLLNGFSKVSITPFLATPSIIRKNHVLCHYMREIRKPYYHMSVWKVQKIDTGRM